MSTDVPSGDTLQGTSARSQPEAPLDLGGGLILRPARLEDAAAVAKLAVEAHAAAGSPAESAGPWVLDMMARPHPTMTPEDVVVVEDTRAGLIVSTANVIPQTWAYGGVTFGVGRFEVAATHPEYRGRGLLVRVMDVLHRRSVDRGDLLHAISGTPKTRRLGYEYALELGGGRTSHRAHVAPLPPGEVEPFRVRPATEADLPALMRIDARASERSLVSCVRDEASFRYEIRGRSEASILHSTILALEAERDGGGEVVGFAVLGSGGIPNRPLPGSIAILRRLEIAPGVSWYAAVRCLSRHLTGKVPDAASRLAQHCAYEELRFLLGEEHPAYAVAPGMLARPVRPGAWYIRVPDLPAFLNHVAPVLEARLGASPMAGFTGQLVMSFYDRGLRLSFERGRVAAEGMPGVHLRGADALFPGLVVLRLLLGYRNLDELEHAFPDCGVPRSEEARLLLNALFPRSPSAVWPIG